MSTEIDYDKWYPDVKPVMDVQDMAKLLSTNDQIIRLYVREGTLPAHRRQGGRKMHFLRHEVFNWLIENRYKPDPE